jgi:hypothetical protein
VETELSIPENNVTTSLVAVLETADGPTHVLDVDHPLRDLALQRNVAEKARREDNALLPNKRDPQRNVESIIDKDVALKMAPVVNRTRKIIENRKNRMQFILIFFFCCV